MLCEICGTLVTSAGCLACLSKVTGWNDHGSNHHGSASVGQSLKEAAQDIHNESPSLSIESGDNMASFKESFKDYSKRPMTAYRLWYRENIKRHALDGAKKLSAKSLAKSMTDRWRKLDSREKEAYLEEARRNKEEYEKVRKQMKYDRNVVLSHRLVETDDSTKTDDTAIGNNSNNGSDQSSCVRITNLIMQKAYHENRIRTLQDEMIKEQHSLLQINNQLILAKFQRRVEDRFWILTKNVELRT